MATVLASRPLSVALEELAAPVGATAAERTRLAQLLTLVGAAREGLALPYVTVTSWKRDAPGDPHDAGAALDVAGPTVVDTRNVWVWLAKNRRSSVGEVILERPSSGVTGHVHFTLPGWGGMGQVLEEEESGSFMTRDPAALAYLGVAELPGLTVTVSRTHRLLWLALAGVVGLVAWRARR